LNRAGKSLLLPLFALFSAAGTASASVTLNEVLYDPDGPDSGSEFVELYNPDPDTLILDGFVLEFANGADGPLWRERWRGAVDQRIPPGGFFLIGDRNWSGPPDAQDTASLALQNGPDAIRLIRDGILQDLLGYGDLEDPDLSEGSAHPGADSGYSLCRRPDGGDTDDNGADWRQRVPSPGEANFTEWSIAVEGVVWEPPSLPAAGATVQISLRLVNDGLVAIPSGQATLNPVGSESPAVAYWLDGLAPESGCWVRLNWIPAAIGVHELEIRVAAAASGPVMSKPLSPFRVGPTAVHLSEVMAAPPTGACEWVELANAGNGPVDLGGWSLADVDGSASLLPVVSLAPGDRLVVVQDLTKHLRWTDRLAADGAPGSADMVEAAAAALEMPGSWPSLNNAPPESREFADRLQLIDPDGVVVDHLVIGAGGTSAPAGRSLERTSWIPLGDPAVNWGPATIACGGTPGLPNSRSEVRDSDAGMILSPNPCRPGESDGALRLAFSLEAGEQGWDARIFDVWGRRVRDLGGDILGPGRRCIPWDGLDDQGRECAVGAYIVLLDRLGFDGGTVRSEKALAVIDGGPGN